MSSRTPRIVRLAAMRSTFRLEAAADRRLHRLGVLSQSVDVGARARLAALIGGHAFPQKVGDTTGSGART
jgi:hypothetical protein